MPTQLQAEVVSDLLFVIMPLGSLVMWALRARRATWSVVIFQQWPWIGLSYSVCFQNGFAKFKAGFWYQSGSFKGKKNWALNVSDELVKTLGLQRIDCEIPHELKREQNILSNSVETSLQKIRFKIVRLTVISNMSNWQTCLWSLCSHLSVSSFILPFHLALLLLSIFFLY